jgi:hypothetical protein
MPGRRGGPSTRNSSFRLRLSQMQQLQASSSGRAFDVEQRQAEVDQLQAQLGRRIDLEQHGARFHQLIGQYGDFRDLA